MKKVYSFALVGLLALSAFGFGHYAHAEETVSTEAVKTHSSGSVTLMPIYFLTEVGIKTTPEAANAVWAQKLKDGTPVKDFILKLWAKKIFG